MKILGIPGSLREKSYNKMLLRYLKKISPSDIQFEIFDLDAIDSFNQDSEENVPEPVLMLKAAIQKADGIIIATPEYNYSIPGVLKNAIDWSSRPYGQSAWDGKKVALVGASVGRMGTVRAQMHLRQCFIFLNIQTLNAPEIYVGEAQDKFDESGNLTDSTTQSKLKEFLDTALSWFEKDD